MECSVKIAWYAKFYINYKRKCFCKLILTRDFHELFFKNNYRHKYYVIYANVTSFEILYNSTDFEKLYSAHFASNIIG